MTFRPAGTHRKARRSGPSRRSPKRSRKSVLPRARHSRAAVAAFESFRLYRQRRSRFVSGLEARIQAAWRPAAEAASAVDLSCRSPLKNRPLKFQPLLPKIQLRPKNSPELPAETARVEAGAVRAARALQVRPARPPVDRAAGRSPAVLEEFVSDLESSLGDNFLPTTGARMKPNRS